MEIADQVDEMLSSIAQREGLTESRFYNVSNKKRKGELDALPYITGDKLTFTLETNDLVEGLITEGGFSVLYGASNVGKSFLALELGTCVAEGKLFNDLECEQGGVLYIALEGIHGMKCRFEALRRRGEKIDKLALISPKRFNLMNEETYTDIVKWCKIFEETEGLPVKLIIIDTLARSMAGGDENAGKDVGDVLTNINKIQYETNAHIMLIHHSGKDASKGARGHSSIRAATDTEIEITQDKQRQSKAEIKKQRDLDSKGNKIRYNLEVVHLGENKRGKSVTSCVVEFDNSTVEDTTPKQKDFKSDDLLDLLPVESRQELIDTAEIQFGIKQTKVTDALKYLSKHDKIKTEKVGQKTSYDLSASEKLRRNQEGDLLDGT